VVRAEMRVGAEDGEAEGEVGGERFSQNRVWFMWPPAAKFMALWRWSWEIMSLLLEAVA